jgi:uncharacterized protein (TIGR00297 family)
MAALAAAAVAGAAWSARWLTRGGAVAATVVGAAVVAGAGWAGGLVLLAFFVPASAVSRVARSDPRLDVKGDRRDAAQVFANGAAAAIGALLVRPAALWIVTASLAAAAADTWATSVGSRSRTLPVHLLTGARVPAGTSGAVSGLGTVGAAVGAGVTALAGALAARSGRLGLAAGIIGMCGMVADSILGATAQGRFHCAACGVPSEWPVHRCGTRTELRGGIGWVSNDVVNGVATALAALAGAAAWAVWSPCC